MLDNKINDWINEKVGRYSVGLADFLTQPVRPRHGLIGLVMLGVGYFGCGDSGGGGPDPVPTPNRAPYEVSSIAPVSLPEDMATGVDVAGNFADPDGDALTYTVSGFTNVQTVVTGSDISIYSNPNFEGTETGSVKACDTSNACATTPLEVTFTPVNDRPVINGVTMYNAQENQVLDGQINAVDPDLGDTLTYLILDNFELPELMIDPSTGQLYSAAPLGYNSSGDKNIQLRVTDSTGLLDEGWYVISIADVNRAPTITGVVINQAEEGKVLNGVINGWDPDSDPVTCYLVSSDLPEAKVSSTCFIYSDIVLPPDPQALYNIVVGMTDGFMDDTFSKDFGVQRPPTTPYATCGGAPCGPNFGVDEGPFFPMEFNLNSTDPNGDPITYQGINLPTGANLDPNTGLFSWSPDCTQGGITYTVGLKSLDTYNAESGVLTVWIDVNDVCPP